ncbi:homologous-pairing protein 2 homolog [Hydractinia symbiolongicarpus]|uniref:homologous-pairing protein 2 homolog n=1 Tax=Hydractinia symbiolongicarpus TaxID=13093 RepID=UPI00254FDEA0|nr:homologous-pairing protein 2 homolog [Hydractinia symbiolongicarpus]
MSKKRDPEVGILQYLNQQNRPYSAVDIFNNLHKEFGKTAVVKALESLTEKNKIIEKTYGKQKVYSPLQDQYGDYNETEIKALDLKLSSLQEEVNILQQESKKYEAEINKYSSQMSTKNMVKKAKELKNNNEILQQRISKLRSGTTLMTKEDRLKLYNKKDKMLGQWKKRKRMTSDVLNAILEGYPKSKKQLLEEVGVETDEDVGVQIPK